MGGSSVTIKLKRAYEAPAEDDGLRVLVDRLWPRGVSKDSARIDLWAKEITPSTELRTWYGHDPARWAEFRKRYFQELDGNREAVAAFKARIGRKKVTFVYGAKDTEHSHALALKEYLERDR
jgi:uncharacterized protein YeaO (DUF488 family)